VVNAFYCMSLIIYHILVILGGVYKANDGIGVILETPAFYADRGFLT
jgi:hypothetical protein